MFGHIIMKAIGVFDIPLDSSAKPIRQIKIKDIFDNDNYKVLLYTTENRVHIYAFEQDTRGIYTNSDKPFLLDNSVLYQVKYLLKCIILDFYKLIVRLHNLFFALIAAP